jgi:Zn-dependent peptidase ImmA (M78 family)
MKLATHPNKEDIVAALLEMTDTNLPPTNPERIAKYLELTIIPFDNHEEYGLNKRIRAFLSVEHGKPSIIGVHRKLMRVQIRFSILHEIGHFVLPGHLTETQKSFEDTASTFRAHSTIMDRVSELEIEANKFAADCLFQLGHFDNHIGITPMNWDNIISAADKYGASIEATARRWVEKSKEDCALLVFKPFPSERKRLHPRLETMYTITSKTFESLYFSRIEPGQKMDEGNIVHQMFHNPHEVGSFADGIMEFSPAMKFNIQLFNNRYRVFGLLTPE